MKTFKAVEGYNGGTKLKSYQHKRVWIRVFLVIIVLSVPAIFMTWESPLPVIRLHDDQVDIQRLNNEIVGFIIENGYGYPVERVENTIKEVRTALVEGDVDISLEIWKENNIVWYQDAVGSGDVVDLGVLYASGRQFWLIPRWFARENKIRTVFDMKRVWREFADHEDPSKGVFFNCIYGWACRDINRVKLAAYGLDRFYNPVSPSSPEALRAIYRNAIALHIPVFGYYWEPNVFMPVDDWYILEEPAYSQAVWYQVIKAATDARSGFGAVAAAGVRDACAYGDNTVAKMAHTGLLKKAPEVAEMFRKMRVRVPDLEKILNQGERGEDFFEAGAILFLKRHPDQWHDWVPESVRDRVSKALEKIGR